MSPHEFTTALTTLGLDNHQAAQWLGVSVKSVRRYRVSGAPGPVAGMVRLALMIDEVILDYRVPLALSLALDWRE